MVIFFLIWLVFVVAISIILHELAHAWAAKICGFDVHAIRFGLGDPIRKWRWNHIEISIGIPASIAVGAVEFSDRGRGTIAQRLFVAISGVAANALLVFIASMGDVYFRYLDNYWSFLGIFNMILVIVNLIPMAVARRGQYTKIWSDGGRIAGLIQEQLTGRNFSER